MRPLSFLFATTAVATSLKRRQENAISINSTTASGRLCGSETFTASVSPGGDVVTLGFSDYRLGTPVGLTRGDCNIELSLIYPPGCTRALLDIFLHSFFTGGETVTSYMEVDVGLSTGRRSTGSEIYRNRGPALDSEAAAYGRRYPMDASIQVNEEDGAEVVLTVALDSQIESVDGSDGTFTLDDITILFDISGQDPDWQFCV